MNLNEAHDDFILSQPSFFLSLWLIRGFFPLPLSHTHTSLGFDPRVITVGRCGTIPDPS